MTKLTDLYRGNYLKASDFERPVMWTISSLKMEEIGDEPKIKPVLYFSQDERGLVLNKTNAMVIGGFLGDETDEWLGKRIVLFKDRTTFGGQMVDCIRVRKPKMTSRELAAQAVGAEVPEHEAEDDIPF